MLELMVGIDAVQRLTRESLALEPTRRPRPAPARRSRAATAGRFLSAAIVGLAGPTAGARAASGARNPLCEARAD